MKIAYLGKFDTLWNEESIAQGLETYGAEVFRIEENQPLKNIQEYVERFQPDVFLGAKYQITGAWELIEWLRKRKIPSASWTFDLLIGHPPREAALGTYAFLSTDLVILTDGGHDKEFKKRGIKKKTLRQGIPEQFCYMAEPEEGPDIVFVGTENPTFPYRQETMKFLHQTYKGRFEWIGKDKQVRGDDLNILYASAKIVIGDSMYSPHYWSNRIYETLGRGGFLIHPRIPGLNKEYTPFQHYIPYEWGDYTGLKEKIDYYLEHSREKIKRAAYLHTKQNHLMRHRCKELYTILNEHCMAR